MSLTQFCLDSKSESNYSSDSSDNGAKFSQRILNQIPQKLLKNSVYVQEFSLEHRVFFHFLINKDGMVFEIKDKAVLRTGLLQNFLDDPQLSVPINPKKQHIEVLFYFTYPALLERLVYYLIKVHKKLYVLQQKPKELELIREHKDVKGYDIVDLDGNYCPKVVISLFSGEVIKTDFSSKTDLTDKDDLTTDKSNNPQEDLSAFNEILKENQDILAKATSELQEMYNKDARLFQELCDRNRHVPRHLRSENQLEKVVLVQYGNIWMRTHNNRLVIGIPIFNATYQR